MGKDGEDRRNLMYETYRDKKAENGQHCLEVGNRRSRPSHWRLRARVWGSCHGVYPVSREGLMEVFLPQSNQIRFVL